MHIIPQLWFRNIWAWGPDAGAIPWIRASPAADACCVEAETPELCALGNLPIVYQLGRRTLCG